MEINLYDANGSCQICSSSTVQRRFPESEYSDHAKRHQDAGDPVTDRLTIVIKEESTNA